MKKVREYIVLLLFFSFGFQNIIMFYGFTLNVYFLVLVLLFSFPRFYSRSKKVLKDPILNIFLFILFYCIISILWHPFPMVAVDSIIKILQLIFYLIILFVFSENNDFLKKIIQAFILGYYVTIVNVLYLFFTNSGGIFRISAENFNPNHMAIGIVSVIPFVFFLVFEKNENRILNLAFIPISFVVLIMSASRSGIIYFFMAIIFCGFNYRKNILQKKNLIYIVFIAVFTIYVLVIEKWIDFALLSKNIERLNTIQSEIKSGTLHHRTTLWGIAIDKFIENPILGVGIGNFKNVNEFGLGTHNSFLSILVELGFFIFFIYIFLYLFIYKSVLKIRNNTNLKKLLLISFLVSILSNFTAQLDFRDIIWIPLFFVYLIPKKDVERKIVN